MPLFGSDEEPVPVYVAAVLAQQKLVSKTVDRLGISTDHNILFVDEIRRCRKSLYFVGTQA